MCDSFFTSDELLIPSKVRRLCKVFAVMVNLSALCALASLYFLVSVCLWCDPHLCVWLFFHSGRAVWAGEQSRGSPQTKQQADQQPPRPYRSKNKNKKLKQGGIQSKTQMLLHNSRSKNQTPSAQYAAGGGRDEILSLCHNSLQYTDVWELERRPQESHSQPF